MKYMEQSRFELAMAVIEFSYSCFNNGHSLLKTMEMFRERFPPPPVPDPKAGPSAEGRG